MGGATCCVRHKGVEYVVTSLHLNLDTKLYVLSSVSWYDCGIDDYSRVHRVERDSEGRSIFTNRMSLETVERFRQTCL